MDKIKSYASWIILAETLVILLFCWMLWGSHKADIRSDVLPSQDSTISKVTVTVYVPMKGLNKKEAREAGIIAKDIAKDDDKAVLASGKVLDDSGSRNISAVLDVKTGDTAIVEKRPFAETMMRFEIGLGYGFVNGEEAKAAQLRATIGRTSEIYLTGQAEVFEIDRAENRHPWNAMMFINYRFGF